MLTRLILPSRSLQAVGFGLHRRCIPVVLHRLSRRPLNTRLSSTKSSESSPTTTIHDADTLSEPSPVLNTLKLAPKDTEYHGPLTATFRRLKIFSLSSLTLTFALTPFIFLMETTSSLPLIGRVVLAGVAVSTSGISTALVAWAGRPYVTTLRWLGHGSGKNNQPADAPQGIEMTTLTLGLHERITRVYDTAFLVPASRPFATWELAEAFQLPAAEAEAGKAQSSLPREETIAETTTANGDVIGRWIVRWDESGAGVCRAVGQVPRYFNVHKELLNRHIQ